MCLARRLRVYVLTVKVLYFYRLMVQQLSLTAHVPPNKVSRLRLALRSLTGDISHPMNIHSVILKPRFPFTPEIIPGKVSQIESYRVRMNRVWETGHPSDIATTDEVWGHSITSVDSSLNDSIWTIQLSDIPLAGQNSVLVQNIHESTIYETDDIIGYLDELGYMHENEFWINGLRFYYGNIIMELTQLYIIDKATTSQSNEIDLTLKGESNQNTSLDKITQKKLKVFNSKGSYHLKCFINIGSLNDLENVSYAIKQLEILKKELSEIVDLKVPDRTLMDSRINSRIANTGR